MKKKRLVVLGGGESGVGAALLGQKEGFDVFLSDNGKLQEPHRKALEQYEIDFEEQGHTEERILQADEVVKSPGIPDTVPIVRKIREKGIPVISEIELGGRYTDAKIICVTGATAKQPRRVHLSYPEISRTHVGWRKYREKLCLQVAEDQRDYYVLN